MSLKSTPAQDVLHSRTSLREKTEDVSGSKASLHSRDDVLLSSRRSSRSHSHRKDSARSKPDTDHDGQSSARITNPDKLMGSSTSLQNIPDDMGSNVSLTSASGLMTKMSKKNGKKFAYRFVAASVGLFVTFCQEWDFSFKVLTDGKRSLFSIECCLLYFYFFIYG